ncbi:MAG: 2-dehydro-3-deoxygalactonokinase [Burkholderiales bacterium]|nr:2-dehydro-3-deoxygalactonokinase [Burkholderiales bacterium]
MIAIDWGTSSFRAYRLARDGSIVQTRAAPMGIMQVEDGRFAQALQSRIGDWLAAGETRVLMSGMIGSRQGWKEAPYVSTPAGADAIAAGMVSVAMETGAAAWIAPGVCTRDAAGVPDVMRGEETQILGVLESLPVADAWICLPGTHSKWVYVRERCIERFTTFMTGEVFAVLKAHSILGRMMDDVAVDLDAFDAGLDAGAGDGLLHRLFGVRARALFGELPAGHSGAYLSGLLIGSELASLPQELDHACLLGSSELTRLYRHALERRGVRVQSLDQHAAAAGLHILDQTLEHMSP